MKIIRLKNETTGEEKEIRIPDDFDYDKIINRSKDFKDYDGSFPLTGYWFYDGYVKEVDPNTYNYATNRDTFATKELAESVLALAQLSQIIKHDAKLNDLHVDKKMFLDANSFKDFKEQYYDYYVVTVEYNYDKKGIDYLCIKLGAYVPFDSITINDLFLHTNNYLIFIASVDSEIEIINKFIKENEVLIRKYLMVC